MCITRGQHFTRLKGRVWPDGPVCAHFPADLESMRKPADSSLRAVSAPPHPLITSTACPEDDDPTRSSAAETDVEHEFTGDTGCAVDFDRFQAVEAEDL
jgi:hypothetical protein